MQYRTRTEKEYPRNRSQLLHYFTWIKSENKISLLQAIFQGKVGSPFAN